MISRWGRGVPAALALFAGYLAAAKLGLSLAFVQENASPVWPCSGLTIGALWLMGPRWAPLVWLAAFTANALFTGVGAPAAAVIATGNVLEALLGSVALRALTPALSFPRHALDGLRFSLSLAMATLVSALVGVLAGLWGSGAIAAPVVPHLLLTWWVGDFGGAAAIAPLFAAWVQHRAGVEPRRRTPGHRIVDAGWIALLVGLVAAIFGPLNTTHLPLAFLPWPILLLLTLRLGLGGLTSAFLVFVAIATTGTFLGYGPFVEGAIPLNDALALIQVYAFTTALLVYSAYGVVRQRRAAHTRLSSQHELLQHQERALAEQNARLTELDRLKTDFVNTVSHELRTPLTSLIGFTEFLEEEVAGPLTEAQRDYVRLIQSSAGRLTRLVDDLLDFSRLQSNTLRMDPALVDLHGLLASSVAALAPQAQARHQTLRYDPAPQPLVGAVDAERIGQVVTNLLGNALKFTPAGGAITLTSEREGDRMVLSVQDTGPGVPKDHQARLFERFYQVDPSTTRQAGGLGLGLAIAKAIVEAHGGTIGYVPPPTGPGARFVVTLPLARDPEAALAEPSGAS